MEVLRDWYFLGAGQVAFSAGPHLLQASLIYYAWFGLSLALGALCRRVPLELNARSLRIHGIAAVVSGLCHLLIVVASIALVFPWRINAGGFANAYAAQFVQWFHFELIVYAAVALAWTNVLAPKPRQFRRGLLGKQGEEKHFVLCSTVEWLEADDNYVIAHTPDRQIRIRATLKRLESELDPTRFVRVHRSALVNVDKVRRLAGLRVETRSGARPPCSKAGRKNLDKAFSQV
ncbi:MAG: LytTR family DNA-binding domain-containing protein [Pseudomonadota bacterium]